MEDIDISREPVQQIVEEPEEKHNFLPLVFAGLALAIIILIGFFVSQYGMDQKTPFNIPADIDSVIIFDNDTLYSFEPELGELNKLGVFDIANIDEAVISSDLLNILFSRGNVISKFTSFDDGAVIATHSEPIESMVISSNSILFSSGELNDRNERKIYRVLNGITEVFSLGSTPFFLDSGMKAVVGTYDGFRIFDLGFGDFLDSETPTIPIASVIKASKSGNKVVLISRKNSIHVYTVISNRPLSLYENFFMTVPEVYDAALSDDGSLVILRPFNNKVYLSIYSLNAKEPVDYEVPVTKDAKILIWNK